MGRRPRRSHRGSRRPLHEEAEAVLAGSVSPTVRELVDLIVAVNPTERELDRDETAERYRLKSALQSLLLERFGDEIAIEPESEEVVSLRHRYGAGFACHAVISELDDEARSRVRRAIDEAVGAAASMRPPAETLTPSAASAIDEIIAAGERAADEYDFDAARERFEEALVRTGGGVVAARPLLDLLVDQLCLDDEARAIEGRLDDEARADEGLRVLLAIAAARRGDEVHARRLVQRVSERRAADVFAVIAQRALDRGDVAEASEDLIRLVHLDPAHAERVRLEAAIAAQRRDARRPLETALEEHLAAGRHDEVRQQARSILARWPDSEVAHRALATLDERAREAAIAALVAEADAAERADDLDRAARRLHDAIARGGRGLNARAEALSARARARREREEIAVVVRAHGAGDLAGSARGYLGLAPAARSAVRAQIRAAESEGAGEAPFAWLDAIDAGRVRSSRDKTIAAVEALWAATVAFGAGDTRAAMDRLEPHRRVLRPVRAAEELWHRAEVRLEEERRATSRAALRAGERALAAEDLEGARAAIEAVDPRWLAPPDRETFAALRDRFASYARVEALVQELDRGDDAIDLARAWALLDELSARDEAGEARRAALEARLVAHLEARWAFVRLDGADADDPRLRALLCGLPLPVGRSTATRCLTPRGDTLAFAAIQSGELVVWWLEVTGDARDTSDAGDSSDGGNSSDGGDSSDGGRVSGRIVRAMAMRPPRIELGSVTDIVADEDVVVIATIDGSVLEIDPERGPVAWRQYSPVGEGWTIRNATLHPGPDRRWLWLDIERHETPSHIDVVDLQRGERARRLDPAIWSSPVIVDGSGMLLQTASFDDQLADARGNLRRDFPLPTTLSISAAGPSPRGDEALTLVGHRRAAERARSSSFEAVAPPGSVVATLIGPDGAHGDVVEIRGSHSHLPHVMGVSRRDGLAFVLDRRDTEAMLTALRPRADDPRGVELHYELPVERASTLFTDARGSRVGLVEELDDGLVATMLDANPRPTAKRGPPRCPDLQAELGPPFECPGAAGFGARALRARLEADGLLAAAPPPPPALEHIFTLAEEGAWDAIRSRIDTISPATLEALAPPDHAHFHHVAGVALLRDGRVEEAIATWQRAPAGSHCRLDACVAVARVILGEPRPDDWGPHQAARGAAAILDADVHLAHEHFDAAIALVAQSWLLRFEEPEALARLASAYLRVPPRTPADRLCRRIALAWYLNAHEGRTASNLSLPLASATWSAARHAALGDEVRAALRRS